MPLFSNETLENLFRDDVIVCSKKGIPVDFLIPECDGELITLEGKQSYLGRTAANGDEYHVLIVSSNLSVANPPYPVLATEFRKRYEVVDGKAIPHSLAVQAVVATEEGQLATAWGSLLDVHPGNYILRYKKHDFAAIDREVFAATYNIL